MSKRHRRRRRSWPRTIFLMVLVALALAGIYHGLFRTPQIEPSSQSSSSAAASSSATAEETAVISSHNQRKADYFIILVSGIDDGNGGSDTNILVSVDAADGAIHCISVPRDTLVNVSRTVKKINAAYNLGGTTQLASEISDTLGVPVDFTIQVDLNGFVDLVDAIGGVDFEIPINMDYDDPLQNLSIHFSKGLHHLSGEDAIKVVRFRHNNDGSGYGTEDIGRIGTQQAFLKAVAKQTLTLSNVGKVSAFSRIFQKYVETDLTLGNLAWLGKEAISVGADNITFDTLPGDGSGYYKGIAYYTLDPDATLEMVNTALNPYVENRTAADLDILVP